MNFFYTYRQSLASNGVFSGYRMTLSGVEFLGSSNMEMRGRMKDDIYTRQQHANGTLLLLKARLFQGISVRIVLLMIRFNF